jgi:hypothetical protein
VTNECATPFTPKDEAMFLIDDLLAAPRRGLTFVLEKILTVRKFSSVRNAGLSERAAAPSIGEEQGQVSRHRSADAAIAPSRPRSQEESDDRMT